MTLSFANLSAAGGTIDKPAGGGRFFEDGGGALPKGLGASDGFVASGPSPFADFNKRDSIIDLC